MSDNDNSPWIPIGKMPLDFEKESNILQHTDDLVGKKIVLHFKGYGQVEHEFLNETQVKWSVLTGVEEGVSDTETFTATSLRDGIYFVDFTKNNSRAMSVSLVLDFNKNVVTGVIAQLSEETEALKSLFERVLNNEELTDVRATMLSGSIDCEPIDGLAYHSKTDELIGKTVCYQYSPYEHYEHVYLNQSRFTWHCTKGVRKDLADTESCQYYKIDDELYFFVWREKIIPTVGMFMVDLKNNKGNGKIMGYEGSDFDKLSNFEVGALISLSST